MIGRFCHHVLLAGLLCLSGPAFTVDGPKSPQTTLPAALDFELADAQRFIRLSDLPARVTVVNFWRYDCPPCLRELPLLSEAARQDKARIITIALHRPGDTARLDDSLQTLLHPPLMSLSGPPDPKGLLQRFGNPAGALPYTVFLDPQRRSCARHFGELTAAGLAQALQRCQRHSAL